MKVPAAIAEILKREGVDILFGYPRNAVLEAAAEADIRTVIVRQERTGLHMADAYSRMTRGRKMGVFAMQHGPGTENAYGAVAQAYSESIPVLVLPQGYARRLAHDDGADIDLGGGLQHGVAWIAEQDVDPLALEDLRDRRRNFHLRHFMFLGVRPYAHVL